MKTSSLVAFAIQDLWAPGARRTTIAVFLTILLISAFTLAAYGLAIGSARVDCYRIEKDPLALCLLVGDRINTKGKVTATVRDMLDATVSDSIPDKAAYRGCFPFRVNEFFVNRVDGRGMTALLARTILIEEERRDPLMQSRPLRPGGRDFDGPADKGIIVSPRMLAELGLPQSLEQLDFVEIQVSGQLLEIAVLGIMQDDLPGALDFVIPEAYEQMLTTTDPKPLQWVFTNAMPQDWPQPSNFPAPIKGMFNTWKMDLPLMESQEDGRRILMLQSRRPDDEWPTFAAWGRYARRLMTEMEKLGYSTNKEFTKLDHRGQLEELQAKQLSKNCDMAGLYFTDTDQLTPAANACDRVAEVHGTVNRDVIDQLESIAGQREVALGIVTIFEAVVMVMAGWNLIVIQVLRAAQKTTEAGMLKAIGMTRGLLFSLVLIEAALVWAIASGLGILTGWIAGNKMSLRWYADPQEGIIGYDCSLTLLLAVLLGSCAFCLLSSLFATWAWHRNSPAKLLSSN